MGFILLQKQRRLDRIAQRCLFQFPRCNKSHIARLFHHIRYKYHTMLSSKLPKTTEHCNRPSTIARSQLYHHFHREN